MSAPIPLRPRLELRRERNWKRPTVRVRARAQEAPHSEWASLLGDLTRGSRAPSDLDVVWRIHDKTHIEFAIDYPFEGEAATYTWDAFFFVPDSFRLAQTTYDKKQIYDDLLSYVRLAVPELPFADLSTSCDSESEGSLAHELRSTLLGSCGEQDGSRGSKLAVRRLRVFACMVRASGLEAQRRMLGEIEQARSAGEAKSAVSAFVAVASRATKGFRKLVVDVERRELPGEVQVALKWVDEDISLFMEALTATASVVVNQRAKESKDGRAVRKRKAKRVASPTSMRERRSSMNEAVGANPSMFAEAPPPSRISRIPMTETTARSSEGPLPSAGELCYSDEEDANRSPNARCSWKEVAALLASAAVVEARYRQGRGYPSVGHDDATSRDVEHIEFRRHVLKRFTSSVLWLRHEVRDGATWVLHALYALAAACAMVFAVFATLRATQMQGYVAVYVILLVASYAIKDRMKAFLQGVFARWAEKRFPDRAWTILGEQAADKIGVVKERAGFRDFSHLPAGVLIKRRMTREHALEEHARPETVLWHQKNVEIIPRKRDRLPSPMMTEIFRLNIGPWLSHTDDPNRTITFADPDNEVVCSVSARRVYNINVVYRLRKKMKKGAKDLGWRRIRVVVSRKGIERIDPIA